MRAFKVRRFLELMAAERVTITHMVPAMYDLCLLEPDFRAFNLSSWRIGGFGSAPMPEVVIADLTERLPQVQLINGCGATETTLAATLVPFGHTALHPESVGRMVPCAEVRIMDEAGREVPPGEAGEVWIKGPMVVPGYFANDAATRAAFVAGFWRSGDIGEIDAAGYLRVLDRRKDMINRVGYKVFSAEVENVLGAHPGGGRGCGRGAPRSGARREGARVRHCPRRGTERRGLARVLPRPPRGLLQGARVRDHRRRGAATQRHRQAAEGRSAPPDH
jgi:acyl-CoA synthetase (AMP-forming)/AMP-acid ligase II